MRIRPAIPADALVATRIIGEALAEFGIAFDPVDRDADVQLFGSRMDHDDFVAEENGTPAGLASLGPQGEPGVGWVSKVFVTRSVRRRGVGRALLEHVHAAASRRGYVRLGLRTRTVFREAIALYEAAGYIAVSSSVAAFDLGTGDLVYTRVL